MYPIYVGDGRDIAKRIRSNHTSGNVEGSSFRQHIAEAWGWKPKKSRALAARAYA